MNSGLLAICVFYLSILVATSVNANQGSVQADAPPEISDDRLQEITQLLQECPRYVENGEWNPSGGDYVHRWLKIDQPEQAIRTIDAILEQQPDRTFLYASLGKYWLKKDRPDKVLELVDKFDSCPNKLIGNSSPDNTLFDQLFIWYCKHQDYATANSLAGKMLRNKSDAVQKEYLQHLNWHAAKLAAANNDFLVAEECLQQCRRLKYSTGFLTTEALRNGRYGQAMSYYDQQHPNRQAKLLPLMAKILVEQGNRQQFQNMLRHLGSITNEHAKDELKPASSSLQISARIAAIKTLSKTIENKSSAESEKKWRNELIESTLKLIKPMPYGRVYYRVRRDLCKQLLTDGRIQKAIEIAEHNCPTDRGFHSALDTNIGFPFTKLISDKVKTGHLQSAIDAIESLTHPTLRSEVTDWIEIEDLKKYPVELRRQFIELDIKNRLEYTRSPGINEDMRFFYLDKVCYWLLELEDWRRLREIGEEFQKDYSGEIHRRQMIRRIQDGERVEFQLVTRLGKHLVGQIASELIVLDRAPEAIELTRLFHEETSRFRHMRL